MVITEGPEDVGGIYAMCTHPAFSRHGIASLLLDEAHNRMRATGLRLSTLGTARHRGAYRLYQKNGYEDLFIPTSTIARRESTWCDTPILAKRADATELPLTDDFFSKGGYRSSWVCPATRVVYRYDDGDWRCQGRLSMVAVEQW